MGLQGALSDFGIAEILQLIGSQQKTGVLHVEGGPEEEVWEGGWLYLINSSAIK